MTRSPVTRALIPCGGKGTRMASLTNGGAKELLPVGGIPLVLRVMEECSASGIAEVLIVSSPGKNDLADVVQSAAGRRGMPRKVEVVVQHDPRGLADAIRLGRDFAAGSPIAVALPDNLFLGDTPALAQLIAVHRRTGKNVVAIVEVSAAERDRYGPTAVYSGELERDEYVITRIPDKGPSGKTFDTKGASAAFTGVGRYVFLPETFNVIDDVDAGLSAGSELDDVPVMQRLLAAGELTGCLIRGDFLDVGLPAGYHAADGRFTSTS
jgi:UTP--glucose-1-phosphate uridylyltransferase